MVFFSWLVKVLFGFYVCFAIYFLMSRSEECSHGDVEFLGTERCERGVNRYYRCRKCGAVLVLSEDGRLYIISGSREEKKK